MKFKIALFCLLFSFDFVSLSHVQFFGDVELIEPPSPIANQSRKRKDRTEQSATETAATTVAVTRISSSTATAIPPSNDIAVSTSSAAATAPPIGHPDVFTPEYFLSKGLFFNQSALEEADTIKIMNLMLVRQINRNLARRIGMFHGRFIPAEALYEYDIEIFAGKFYDHFIESLIEDIMATMIQDV